jgi:hypothetical protein
LAHEKRFVRVIVPKADSARAALISWLEEIPVESLTGLVNHLSGSVPNESCKPLKRCILPELG